MQVAQETDAELLRLAGQQQAPKAGGTDDALERMAQQVPEGTDAILETLAQGGELAPPPPPKMQSPAPSLMTGVNLFAEKVLSQPRGQLGAAEDVTGAQPPRPVVSTEIPPFLSDIRRKAQLIFPNLGQHPPTSLEMDNLAKKEPAFAPVWQRIDEERAASYRRAKELHGDSPDWDKIDEDHFKKAVDEMHARWEASGHAAPGGPLDPRMMDNVVRYAEATAVPGETRRPITGAEAAKAGWDAINVRNKEEIDQLPPWLQRTIGAAAEGAKFGLATLAFPEAPGLVGGVSEAGRQALGVASGAQPELNPGEILLSAALMKGASAAGAGVKAAGGGAIAQTAATVGTFEAAAGVGKAVEAMRPKKPGEVTEKDERSGLRQVVDHILDTVVTAATAGLVHGVGKAAGFEAPTSPKAPAEAPPERISLREFRGEPPKPPKPVPTTPPSAEEVAGVPAAPASKSTNYDATKDAGKALKSTIKSALGMKEPDERHAERDKKIDAEVVPVLAKIEEKGYALNKLLDEAAKGDRGLRDKVRDAARIAVQTEGAIPIPETAVVPEVFKRIVDATRELGKANVGMGGLLEKYGKLPYARWQQPGTTSDIFTARGEEPPPGAKLVGGLKYAEDKGHYFPQVIKGEIDPEPAQPVLRGRASMAPGTSELGQAHLGKRTRTFDEAFAADPLDLSLEKSMEVLRSESDLVRKQAQLDLARTDKDVLTTEELPDPAGRERMRQQAEMLDKQIAAKRKEAKLFGPQDRERAYTEISKLRQQRADLFDASKQKLWKQLVGKEFGEFEGMWIHKDALAKLRGFDTSETQAAAAVRLLTARVKMAKVGLAPQLFAQDLVGNVINSYVAGVNILRHYAHAVAVNLGHGVKNANDFLFDAFTRKHRQLGGTADITDHDARTISNLDRKIAELESQEKLATVYKFEKKLAQLQQAKLALLQQLNDYVNRMPAKAQPFAKIPQIAVNGLARMAHWRQAMIDGAAARSAFHQLMEHGIDDSGAFKNRQGGAREAFEHVQGIFDYATLPKAIQVAARVPFLGPMFIRWPAKTLQSTVMEGAARKPSFFGKTIPTPMDTLIASNPTGRAAQAALVGRGVLRLATKAAEAIPLLAGAQKALAARYGYSKKELDQDLEDKFGHLWEPLKSLVKMAFMPGPRDAYGQIQGVDAAQAIPAIQALRYFAYGFQPRELTKDPTGFAKDILFQLSQKNLLGGAGVRAVGGLNSMGSPTPRGFGPGESAFGLETVMVPAAIMRPLEAYFSQQRVPPEERSVMREILKAGAGIPITVLDKKDVVEHEVDRLYREGVVGIEQRDNGSWNYYVKNADSLEAKISRAQAWLSAYEDDQLDLKKAARRRYHKLQHMIDSVGK